MPVTKRDEEGKAEDRQRWAGFDGHVVRIGKCGCQDGAGPRVGDGEADQATDAAEQHAFSNDLADDAAAVRAHGHAHSDVCATSSPTCKEQVGDVGAGNEQHE